MSNSDNKNCHYIVLNSAKNPEITYPITPIFGEVSLQSFSKIPWIKRITIRRTIEKISKTDPAFRKS